jgi:hypothetical protein
MKNPHDLRSAYAPPFLSFPVSAATLHPFSVAAVIAPSGLTPLAPPDPRHAASARAHVQTARLVRQLTLFRMTIFVQTARLVLGGGAGCGLYDGWVD